MDTVEDMGMVEAMDTVDMVDTAVMAVMVSMEGMKRNTRRMVVGTLAASNSPAHLANSPTICRSGKAAFHVLKAWSSNLLALNADLALPCHDYVLFART